MQLLAHLCAIAVIIFITYQPVWAVRCRDLMRLASNAHHAEKDVPPIVLGRPQSGFFASMEDTLAFHDRLAIEAAKVLEVLQGQHISLWDHVEPLRLPKLSELNITVNDM